MSGRMRLSNLLAATLIVCATAGVSAQQPAPTPQPAAEVPAADASAAREAHAPPVPEPAKLDTRTQYPAFLTNSYFGVNIGSMRYLFTSRQLEPGFQAESVEIPHLAARIDLFGHQFFKYLSAQVIYMRPARYVAYTNVNGDQARRRVSEAFGGVTLSSSLPVSDRISVYGEAGWGVTSRAGFAIDGKTVLKDARFGAALLGGGVEFHATRTVDLLLSATYSPGREALHQPSMRLFTTGFRYHMRKLPERQVEENRRAGFFFPENIVRFGYTNGAVGYGANEFFSSVVPIFWGGDVRTGRGVTVDYERNVFHTRERFAFDLGVSASAWTSRDERQGFRTLSAYPLFRFMLFRTNPADVYASYSLAGPTFISRTLLDHQNTGARFTFQDFMAIGAFVGQARRINVELGIKHYSNGNIFTRNAAIRVPLTFMVGWVF